MKKSIITEKFKQMINNNQKKYNVPIFQKKQSILFQILPYLDNERYRDIDINQFDLNVVRNVKQLQQIDHLSTPLICTSYFGLTQVTKILLKNRQIDVDLESPMNKQTPLLIACYNANYQIVRQLLLAKAQVNKPNSFNHIPLFATLNRLLNYPSCFQNKRICLLIADILIKYGADVNWIIDKKHELSILHYFCKLKTKINNRKRKLCLQIIQYLLKNGANPKFLSIQNENCEQILKRAFKQEQLIKVSKYFKQQPVFKEKIKTFIRIDTNYFKINKAIT